MLTLTELTKRVPNHVQKFALCSPYQKIDTLLEFHKQFGVVLFWVKINPVIRLWFVREIKKCIEIPYIITEIGDGITFFIHAHYCVVIRHGKRARR
ncbi:hypothetical protein VCRA2110O318_120109 [Vibrio crassostreae]|nr:hypothetical protein VCRA2110O318_120109 [Vibrio crassostreae]CAK2405376.1 hypothetical protein VCRA2110O319_120110 [Vibrio crassostreae]